MSGDRDGSIITLGTGATERVFRARQAPASDCPAPGPSARFCSRSAPTAGVGSLGRLRRGRLADHEQQTGPGWHERFADPLLGIHKSPELADLLSV
jgi:hypothetical protein